jgi:hypothetical protein
VFACVVCVVCCVLRVLRVKRVLRVFACLLLAVGSRQEGAVAVGDATRSCVVCRLSSVVCRLSRRRSAERL